MKKLFVYLINALAVTWDMEAKDNIDNANY